MPLPTRVPRGTSVRASTPVPPALPPSRLLESRDGSHTVFQGGTRGRVVSAGATEKDVGMNGSSRHGFSSEASGGTMEGGDGACREGGGGSRTRTLLKSMKEALGPGFKPKEQVPNEVGADVLLLFVSTLV